MGPAPDARVPLRCRRARDALSAPLAPGASSLVGVFGDSPSKTPRCDLPWCRRDRLSSERRQTSVSTLSSDVVRSTDFDLVRHRADVRRSPSRSSAKALGLTFASNLARLLVLRLDMRRRPARGTSAAFGLVGQRPNVGQTSLRLGAWEGPSHCSSGSRRSSHLTTWRG
jgi:hypothetical protein